MDAVIILSSDSDSDSDVEFVGSYRCHFNDVKTHAEPLPLTSVRVDVSALNVNTALGDVNLPTGRFIDLTDPQWSFPDLKARKRQHSTSTADSVAVVHLTDNKCLVKKESQKNQTLNFQKSSSAVLHRQQNGGEPKPKHRRIDPQTQHHKRTDESHHCPSFVKLRRLPFLETHVTELTTSQCSVFLTKDSTQLHLRPPDCSNREEPVWTSPASNGLHMEPSLDELPPSSPRTQGIGSFVAQNRHPNKLAHTRVNAEITQHPPSQVSNRRITFATSIEHIPPDGGNSRLSDHSSPRSPPNRPTDPFDQVDPTASSEHMPAEGLSEWRSEEATVPELGEPALSASRTRDVDDGCGTGEYEEDVGMDSPVSFHWQEENDEEPMSEESEFDLDLRAAGREDRQYVCPFTLGKSMSGRAHALIDEEAEGIGAPEMVCRPSLSLVYSTIEENYPEGTLQLLTDLMQPAFYPPKEITAHLLHDILLDPQCSYHLCVQAFNLLMRTQRHHMVDKTTVPWDWELLASVISPQDQTKSHRCEVVRMFLEYVVQTLEDDFQAKRSTSALHHSIAKATLSCVHQFPNVREVIKWLFSTIEKSTQEGESKATVTERDECIRMVSIFQRMLSLALEVDRSPPFNSAKLSQELFHMHISKTHLRAHRMLLLESLRSELLRCKLLEHLLDYACPRKIPVPMSLRLLLHFLQHCALKPDPTDGTERWQKWEELIHLLWMLLLSYNNAMRDPGHLSSSVTEQRGGVGTSVDKQDDKVSKPDVLDAVESFLSRSQADMGQALPLHVDEALTYLQDHLLDVCQC